MPKLRFPAASTADSINGFPFEVLDHIFQDCLALEAPSYDLPEWSIEHLFPYNASNVCTRWRQILTAHRRYWKYVFIDIARDPAPFLDVIAQFHADYTTKGVVIFSSIRNETPVQVPRYYTADFENARAGQIVKRLMPIVTVCTRITFDLVYQSSLPSVADILRPYNRGLTQLCLTCVIHDCDLAIVGVPDCLQYPEGDDDSNTDTDSSDSDEDDDLHSSDEAQDNQASSEGDPPAHIADETGDAPTTSGTGPHDNESEPAHLSALTKLHITGSGLREMFELGLKWQLKAFPHGNDKLDLHIDHLRIGPYLYNGVESCRELNSLTQFNSYISCMSCRITFSDISLHYSVEVDDPDYFDRFMARTENPDDISTIEFPALTFIRCDKDFIAGFLRYTWIGETLFEVDSPLITFDSCFIPETYGPRKREIEREKQIIPRSLILKNIPLDEEDEDSEGDNGSAGNQRKNSSVVHALKWFPYPNIIQMENCEGLSHSVLMTLTRDVDKPLIKVLQLRNCRGFNATTIRDIIERYQYYAMIAENPSLQLVSVAVNGDLLMNPEDERWFHGGGPEKTSVYFHSRH